MGIITETVYPSESQIYCNTLVIAVNITDWINHNHNCSPFITHQTRSPKSQTAIASSTPKLERLFPQTKQSSLLTIHKPNCLFPKSNNRTFTTHKPDRLFPLTTAIHVTSVLKQELLFMVQITHSKNLEPVTILLLSSKIVK